MESRWGMVGLYFLLGLLTGLGLWGWWQHRFNRRLAPVLRLLHINPLRSSAMERLVTAIQSQQQHAQELEQHLLLWQQLLDAAPIAYLQVDADNQLCWSNQQLSRLLGLNYALIAANQRRLLLEIVRSYDLDRLIDQTRHRQQPCQQDWIYRPSLLLETKGQPLPLRGYGLPLPAGQVGVFLEDRQEAVRLKEERERWTSDVAHELKTPLTSIRLVAEMVHDRVEPTLQPWVGRLLQETVRLSLLVQDLLELNRMAFQPATERVGQPLDLASVIRTAWKNLEPLANQKQLHLDYRGFETLWMTGDETQLYRVLLNLLDNSIRYSPEHSTIRVLTEYANQESDVGCENAAQRLSLQVIDFGPGFSPADLPQVFERFYRGDPARSRQPETTTATPIGSGSGLGLAIVRQIIESHGGTVKARNHPETGGAWLQILLPLNRPAVPSISSLVPTNA